MLSGLRALSAADGLLNAAVAAAMGIHPTDLQAADVLDREGPMTVGALARALHLSPGAATALVDRLERVGLAARRPDATSRRRVLVAPTGEGADRSEALFAPLVTRAEELLAGYGDGSLIMIERFVREATRLISEHAEAIHAPRLRREPR